MKDLSQQVLFPVQWNWKKIFPFFMVPLLLLSLPGYSQNAIVVKGKVTDESGQPIIGASIIVKGVTNGVSTDGTGSFAISTAPNSTLVISSVGFTEKEVKVQGNQFLNITLNHAETGLNAVVVVGYGTQLKEAVTGSVASISGDAMREVPAPNIAQALQGRLPGVEMSQTSTKPGASMQIRVRGRSLAATTRWWCLMGFLFPDLSPTSTPTTSRALIF